MSVDCEKNLEHPKKKLLTGKTLQTQGGDGNRFGTEYTGHALWVGGKADYFISIHHSDTSQS